MSYVLAVDLGTTYTAAAIVRDGGEPQVVTLGHHETSVASVLWLGADGEQLVGTDAARRAVGEPTRVAREFKRRIGDTAPILVGGSPYSAEQLSARLLRSVYDTVCQQEGGPPDGVAVTHPANWGPYKLELLGQLLRLAEIGPTVVLTEPAAAAMHYAAGNSVAAGDVVAVYDLGGGTFDVAVLRRTHDGFEMLGEPEGIERLGGLDFDAAVMGFVADQLGDALADIPAGDADWAAALARLRAECTEAKETLSRSPDATVEAWLPSGRRQVTLTRERFEELIAPPVAETVKAVRRGLQSAHVAPHDVTCILLVGGSSRIPMVRRTIERELAIAVAIDAHPKHAVALGAARFASSTAFGAFGVERPPSQIAAIAEPVDEAAEADARNVRTERIEALRAVTAEVAALTSAHGRNDLTSRMIDRLDRLDHQTVRVLVAGDFKQGKSTLVNALVDREVCPADPDFATTVPTAIRFGAVDAARIHRDSNGDEPTTEPIEMTLVGRYVSETEGADPAVDMVRSCEVELPTPWLSDGVELVDMPGYGGLDAAAGARVIAELEQSQAVLFVSDASQELTAPELDFLRTAVRHTDNVTCVMSKIDAYVDWRVIRDVDTGHLQRAGLDVPIVPVSAHLHLDAIRRAQPVLDRDSGIGELVRLLVQRIMADVRTAQAMSTVLDVENSLGQIHGVLLAELAALDPERHDEIVADLTLGLRNVGDLRLENAAWHRYLRDSTEDARGASTDTFESRLRSLVSEAESAIGANDPTLIWDEFQAWLRARSTQLVSELFVEIGVQVETIRRHLLVLLAAAEGEVLGLGGGLTSPFVDDLRLDVMDDRPAEDRASSVALESSWSAAEPLLGIAGFIPGLGPVSLAVAAIAGLVFGRRALRQRRERALDARRDEAKAHLRDYTSEVDRLVRRSLDRYANQLYRGLRDNVLGRADELERSLNDALGRASAAHGRSASERQERLAQLHDEVATVDQVASQLRGLRAAIDAERCAVGDAADSNAGVR